MTMILSDETGQLTLLASNLIFDTWWRVKDANTGTLVQISLAVFWKRKFMCTTRYSDSRDYSSALNLRRDTRRRNKWRLIRLWNSYQFHDKRVMDTRRCNFSYVELPVAYFVSLTLQVTITTKSFVTRFPSSATIAPNISPIFPRTLVFWTSDIKATLVTN